MEDDSVFGIQLLLLPARTEATTRSKNTTLKTLERLATEMSDMLHDRTMLMDVKANQEEPCQ